MDRKQRDITLTYEEFVAKAMDEVRKDNCMVLVESWEDNIIYKDFGTNQGNTYWDAKIYYVAETSIDKYCVKFYQFDYLVDHKVYFAEGVIRINRDVIQVLTKFENLVARSKDRFLYSILDKFKGV